MRKQWRACAVCLTPTLVVVSSAVAVPTGPAQPPVVSEANVRAGIQRGIAYLRSQQHDKGYWVFERSIPEKNKPQAPPRVVADPSFNLGLTALAALAMVENGVLPSDPAIQKAYAHIKEECQNNRRTYNIGLTILFLTRLGSREDRPLVQRLARRLMLGQHDSGGWSYDCPMDNERETARMPLQGYKRPGGMGDNSNTQFAILGLWAASRAGVQVDEPLELVAKRFRESQAPSGGWDYQSTGKSDSSAMTCAGAYGITVAAAASSRKAARSASEATASKSKTPRRNTDASPAQERDTHGSALTGRAALENDEVFKKAMTRVEQFASAIAPGASPYFLWSIERLAVTLEMPALGKVDWYAKGAKALVESQKSDGSWELAWRGPADTSFALLFLRKANLGRDIVYALSGDATKPFVLIGKEKRDAFAKLSEAVAAASDGDMIDVMGNGPFDVAGVWVEGKSLKIRSGEGFEAALAHKLTLLQDPARDQKLRTVLGVKGTRLILEGLRIQIDPDQKAKVPWAAIVVDAGQLRAVNSSITQSNSATAAGIEIVGASEVNVHNCLVAGFSPAIRAVASANQKLEAENCLFYSRVGFAAKSPNVKQDGAAVTARFSHNTFHVGEVMNLSELAASAELVSEANIFHTAIFSNGIKHASNAPRSWEGRHNVFDLTRWLAASGQPVREVKDLETWRKFWKAKEEGSFTRSAPFAVNHQLGPFRHNTNPNDWRLTVERLSPDLSGDVQLGCDAYLVGAGQAYFQFKETAAYDQWQQTAEAAGN